MTKTKSDGKYVAFAKRLQKHRKSRDMSLTELANRASVSKSNLSRLESGDGNPSLETLWSLSRALEVGVRELIEPDNGPVRVDRMKSLFFAEAEQANFKVALLSSCPIGSTRDIYRAEFEPGKPKVSNAHGSNIVEHCILLSGKARIGPVQDPVLLFPGDHITFSGDQDHVYEALEEGTAAIVIIEQS